MIARMKPKGLKRCTCFVLLSFILLFISDAYPLVAASEQEGLALIEKGEAEYRDGYYREALEYFDLAKGMVGKEKNKKRLYLDISLVHYALGDEEKCREILADLLKINPEMTISEKNYPKGFLRIVDRMSMQAKLELAEREKIQKQKFAEALQRSLELKRSEATRKIEEQKKPEAQNRSTELNRTEDESKKREKARQLEAFWKREEQRKLEEQKRLGELKQIEEFEKKERQKLLEEYWKREEQRKLDEKKKREAQQKAEEEKKQQQDSQT